MNHQFVELLFSNLSPNPTYSLYLGDYPLQLHIFIQYLRCEN
jgi:hypothetical protein